ncbi:hypothetical protein T03_15629 [Trichinella britovi]|uniref:Uncharacterized protein n=1 Tax=Trichinella britovi TaxID=45882 RepID=A0A0V1CM13_TRIBR|nr:hypothetical protein T03_15629 [Trichinella britovi]
MKFGSFDEANCISPCLANYSVSCLLVDHEVLLFVDGRWQCLCFERLIENPDELWSCLSAILVHISGEFGKIATGAVNWAKWFCRLH